MVIMIEKLKNKLDLRRLALLCAALLAMVLGILLLTSQIRADAEETESAAERERRLGPMAYVDPDSDFVSVPAPDESLRPSEPGQWGGPSQWLPEGYYEEDSSITPEEMDYRFAHRFDGIDYDDLFTADGVVIQGNYMDWYIEKVLMEADPMLKVQSNPYVYLDNNKYYQAIVDKGPAAIPELEKALADPGDSGTHGLSAYLFAAAIEEIAQADVEGIIDDRYAIGTAGEFMDYWLAIKKSATKDVRAIALSSEYSNKEKLEKIDNYGLLAVPALDELKADPKLSEELKVGLETQLIALGATDQKQVAYTKECLAL
jgi:hypothetical protein